MKSFIAVVGLLLATTSCAKRLDPAFEGTITIRETRDSGTTVDTTMEFKNGKCRIEKTKSAASPDAMHFYTVLDTHRREAVAVLEKEKSYTKADYATVLGMHPEEKPPKRTAIDKKSSSTIAGFACSNWEVKTAYGPREEVCATPFIDLSVDRAGPGREDGATGLPDPTWFPLRTVAFDSKGKELFREEVVRIEHRSIDEARFAVPAGYAELKERPR